MNSQPHLSLRVPSPTLPTNPTTNDSNGYGITNHMKNGFTEDGLPSTRTAEANVINIVSGQGSPTDVADFGPISPRAARRGNPVVPERGVSSEAPASYGST